jgi:hypothetical protein
MILPSIWHWDTESYNFVCIWQLPYCHWNVISPFELHLPAKYLRDCHHVVIYSIDPELPLIRIYNSYIFQVIIIVTDPIDSQLQLLCIHATAIWLSPIPLIYRTPTSLHPNVIWLSSLSLIPSSHPNTHCSLQKLYFVQFKWLFSSIQIVISQLNRLKVYK